MTIRTTLIASSLIATSLISGAAHAALEGRDLNGSIDSFEAYYDTDLNITWLADANYAYTSGYDSDGDMSWADANTWAAGLSITDGANTYNNWRLPTTLQLDSSCGSQFGGDSYGYNCTGSEMGHLFYVELGNKGYKSTTGDSPQEGWGLTNTGPFTGFQAGNYWSATVYASDTTYAWYLGFTNGLQAAFKTNYSFDSWAVSDGDVGVSAVPEPETYGMLLAGLGLVGAATRRRRG